MKKIGFHCNSGHQLFFRSTNQIKSWLTAAAQQQTSLNLAQTTTVYSLYLYVRLEKEKKSDLLCKCD